MHGAPGSRGRRSRRPDYPAEHIGGRGGPTLPEYTIRTELKLTEYRAEFAGPGGPVGALEGRLALRGADFLVFDPAGTTIFEAKQPQRFTFFRRELYEVTRNGVLAARIHESFMSFVNPRFRVEIQGREPLAVWHDFVQGEYAFTRRGLEIARLHRASVERGWSRAVDTRLLRMLEGEDDLLLLALATLISRRV